MGFNHFSFSKYFLLGILATQAVEISKSEAFSTFGHFGQATASYKVNPVNLHVSEADALAAVKLGAEVWGTQGGANFAFQYSGLTTKASIDNDNESIVFFRNTRDGSGALALTYSWFSTSNPDVITEFDMVFLDASFLFTTNATAPCPQNAEYIESVGAHEFGHGLGLDHSNVRPSTMYPTTNYCDQSNQRLSPDDIAGIQSLYGQTGRGPASSPTPMPSATPRLSPTPAPSATPAPTPRLSPTPAPTATPSGPVKGPVPQPSVTPAPSATPNPSATPIAPVKGEDPNGGSGPIVGGTPCPGRSPSSGDSSGPALVPGASGLRPVGTHSCGSDFNSLIAEVQAAAVELRTQAQAAFVAQAQACNPAGGEETKAQMSCRNNAEIVFTQAIRQINFDEQGNVDQLMDQARNCPEQESNKK